MFDEKCPEQKKKAILLREWLLVGDDGIEPPQVESESTALPLCKSPRFAVVVWLVSRSTCAIIRRKAGFVKHIFEKSCTFLEIDGNA